MEVQSTYTHRRPRAALIGSTKIDMNIRPVNPLSTTTTGKFIWVCNLEEWERGRIYFCLIFIKRQHDGECISFIERSHTLTGLSLWGT